MLEIIKLQEMSNIQKIVGWHTPGIGGLFLGEKGEKKKKKKRFFFPNCPIKKKNADKHSIYVFYRQCTNMRVQKNPKYVKIYISWICKYVNPQVTNYDYVRVDCH